MANVIRPYNDEQIVDLAQKIEADRFLQDPTVSNVIVAYDDADPSGYVPGVEISWTTTVRVLPEDATRILYESATA